MPDDKDDSFQASMIALHGSTCSADLDYLQVSTPKARQNKFRNSTNVARVIFSVVHLTVCPMCCLLQLAARLDLVHNHPRFSPSSGLAGAAQTFAPEEPTPFAPHIQDFSTILDPHDHFLSQRPPEDEDLSFVGRVNVLEEAVESLHIQQEVATTLLSDALRVVGNAARDADFALNCHPQGQRGLRGRGLRRARADPREQF